MMSHELITSLDFESLMEDHRSVAELITQAHGLLTQAQALAKEKGLGQILAKHTWQYLPMKEFLQPDGASKAISFTDQECWKLLLERSRVIDIMTAENKAEWHQVIDNSTAPPFTREAVLGTFTDLYAAREHTFGQSVVDCFNALDKRFITNGTTALRTHIHIRHFFKGMGYLPGPGTGDEVDDLRRFMAIVDGKPIPHAGAVRQAVMHSRLQASDSRYRDEYIALQWFKNGNAKLTFKRQDLLDALNREIEKHLSRTLPAPRNARHMAPARPKANAGSSIA